MKAGGERSVTSGSRSFPRRSIGAGLVLAILLLIVCSGCSLHSRGAKAGRKGFQQQGIASWYGPGFHGKLTANGETYDMFGLTAAHKELPFDTIVEVRNRENGRSVRVRINDRGPFVRGRIIDLSRGAAEMIGLLESGVAEVSLRVVSSPGTTLQARSQTWLVQAGAFGDRKHAETHLELVRAIDKRARLERGSDMFRVVIGPLASEKDAKRLASSLERKGVAAFVRRTG